MRAGRNSATGFRREQAFEMCELFGIEHMFDAVSTSIYESRIEVCLSQQINFPQPMLPRDVHRLDSPIGCELPTIVRGLQQAGLLSGRSQSLKMAFRPTSHLQ